MDREEIMNTFHWHRWVASRKGSVTISAEDMDLYCVLINKLIANVGAQDMTISDLRKLLEKANHDADRYAQKIKELTEENERLRADNIYGLSASNLAKKVEKLSYENEQLRNRVVCKVVIPDEKLGEIKNECLERVELDIKAIEADTVREMQARVKERLPQLLIDSSYLDVLDEEHWLPAADQLFEGISQIAKEMLEGV